MSLTTLLADHRASLAVPEAPAMEAIPMSAVLSGDTVAALEDINAAVAELDELNTVFTGMESILASLESHKTTPLNEREVQYLNLAVEGYVGKYGMTGALVPSIESAGGIDELVASTESRIGDMLKAAWKWIVDLWDRCREAVLAFFDRIFTEAGRMQRRGKALAEKARKAKGTPSKPELKVGELGARMTIDGKVSSPEVCLHAVEDILDLDWSISQALGVALGATFVKSMGKSFDMDSKDVEEAQKEALDKIAGAVLKATGWDNGNPNKSAALPDGGYFTATYSEAGSLQIEHHAGKRVGSKDAVLAVASLSSLEAAGKSAVKLGTLALGITKLIRNKVLVLKILEADLKSTDKMSAEEKAAVKDDLAAVRKTMLAVTASLKAVSQMTRHCVSSAMVSLAVAEKMVGTYKEAPAK